MLSEFIFGISQIFFLNVEIFADCVKKFEDYQRFANSSNFSIEFKHFWRFSNILLDYYRFLKTYRFISVFIFEIT